MYHDVGKKIKMLAMVGAATGAILGILIGIILVVNSFWAGWVVIVLSIGCIATSWPLYGFGQLVEDIHALRNNEAITTDELPKL